MGIVLKYFPIMGAAERVRLALWLGEIEFEDVRVPPVNWAELKDQTPFGQLPVMSIDEGPYIGQSNAMLQYIGTLAPQLCPRDQFLKVQEAIGLVDDFERAFRPCIGIALEPEKLGYGITPATSVLVKDSPELSETIKALREAFLLNELPKYCGFFSRIIENSGGRFLCGAEPTLSDCCLAPALERYTLGYIDHVPKESLDAYPEMKSYLEAFKTLPQVVAYEHSKS
ncbi:glutathione S-transferase [Paracoccaceae bacterium]|nr:glutathione S-transferase [Paracoccaceae bacterium]MDC0583674.1 glutathione S-transferase [Paracoccaceae bacterium]